MGWILGLGNGVVFRTGSSMAWSTYWSHLISATVEQAAPTNVVLTFPTARTSLTASDITGTVNGVARTISSASWTGAVWTVVFASAVNYGDTVVMTFVPSGGTANVTNNVTHPLSIEDGNTVGWYVFDDLSTITKDAGTGEVSSWRDKLASGHDLLQATATRYPVWNAATGITFDGSNDSLKAIAFTLNQPVFIYAIIKQISWTDGDRVWDGNTNDSLGLLQITTTPRLAIVGAADWVNIINNDNGQLGLYHVVRCLYNGANSSFQINETAKVTGTVGSGNPGGFTLGKLGVSNGGWANITVSEIIVRKVADSAGDESMIYNYLANRKLFFLNNYDNILVLGNSITIHPIVSYWWGEWGMAASRRENDFVHKLESKIRLVNPDCEITPVNIAAWEAAHTTYDLSNFDSYFTTPPDLVIIRIGENVGDETDFDTSIQGLIDYIKTKAPSANIVMTGTFFADASMNVLLSAAAVANGLRYTELSSLNTAENRSSIGAIVYDEDGNPHTVNNSGVAKHPNDTGMKAIADKIFKVIQ